MKAKKELNLGLALLPIVAMLMLLVIGYWLLVMVIINCPSSRYCWRRQPLLQPLPIGKATTG